MRTVLLVAVGILVGAIGGWQLRSLVQEPVRPSESFRFNDNLADARAPYLSTYGTWRGSDIATKINTVHILCDAEEKTCEMNQADVTSFRSTPFLNLYNKSFTIMQLDAERLTAEGLPDACIRQTLFIDRKAKTVSLVRTKINAEGLCDIVQNEPVTISLVDPQIR